MPLPDLGAAVTELARPVYDDLLDAGRDDLLYVLATVPTGTRELKVLADEASRRAVSMFDYQETVVLHGRVWGVHSSGGSWVWDDRAVAHAVVDRALRHDRIDHPRDVADALLRCCRVGYWLVGKLRDRGLNPDAYRRRINEGVLTVVAEMSATTEDLSDLARAAEIRAAEARAEAERLARRNIAERLTDVLADRRGLAKEGWNTQQQFHFRSVEQVAAEGRRLFAAHGIALVPRYRVLDDSTYQTKGGTVMRRVMVEGAYLLTAPDGSSVEACALGESADVMDKATSKAQTMAFKTMLLQLLMMSDPDDDDPDAHSPAGAAPASAPRAAPSRPAPAIEAALAPINALGSAEARMAAKQRFLAEWGQPADLPAEQAPAVEAWVESLLEAAGEEPPS